MKYLALYIAISFIGIAVMGFSGLTTHDSLFSQCVEATIPGGMPCAGQDATHNILQAKLYQGFSVSLLWLVMAFAVAMVWFCRMETASAASEIKRVISRIEARVNPSDSKIMRWSQIHQQHPGRA